MYGVTIKEVFRLTNEFRASSEASYWNKDNTTKTNLVGMLGELTLDEDLCKAATVRANEIVKKFDHTRPNGKSCFSIVDVLGIRWQALGENIAAGSSTAQGTFLSQYTFAYFYYVPGTHCYQQITGGTIL